MPPLSDPTPAFRLGYRPWLDGLRGVAILVVLAQHFHLLHGGFLGVDLFFVLSGFLITTLLMEEWQKHAGISLRRFYIRRALRLLPALGFVLLAGMAYTHVFRPAEEALAFRREALVSAGYVANWPKLHGVGMPTLGHTWSLSLEEQFYLIWPLVLLVLLRTGLPRGAVLACVGGGIFASCALRFTLHQMYRASGKTLADVTRLYMGLDTRADALLTGCLVGLLAVWGLLPRHHHPRRAVAILATLAAAWYCFQLPRRHFAQPHYYDGQFTLVALALGAILVHLLVNPARVWRWVLELPPLVWVGRISYGLYLVHIPLIHWLLPDGAQQANWAAKLAVVGSTLGVAVASFYLVERPFLRLKRQPWAAAGANPPARAEVPSRPESRRLAA